MIDDCRHQCPQCAVSQTSCCVIEGVALAVVVFMGSREWSTFMPPMGPLSLTDIN